jgi:hypothetical protein
VWYIVDRFLLKGRDKMSTVSNKIDSFKNALNSRVGGVVMIVLLEFIVALFLGYAMAATGAGWWMIAAVTASMILAFSSAALTVIYKWDED